MGYIDSTAPYRFPIFDGELFFTEEESAQIAVLFEPLFPANHENGVPGASDARAERFLSQLLALDEVEYYKILEWRSTYRTGLELLDKAAQAIFNKKLLSLSFEEAHSFLKQLELKKIKDLPDSFDQENFFRMMLEHCIQGCFSDPKWGGNSESIMWEWLGWIEPAKDIKFK